MHPRGKFLKTILSLKLHKMLFFGNLTAICLVYKNEFFCITHEEFWHLKGQKVALNMPLKKWRNSFVIWIKLRQLGTLNWIVDNSNSDSNKFGCWLRYKSNSKTMVELFLIKVNWFWPKSIKIFKKSTKRWKLSIKRSKFWHFPSFLTYFDLLSIKVDQFPSHVD